VEGVGFIAGIMISGAGTDADFGRRL